MTSNKLEEALWSAHTLFDQRLVSGSSGNISVVEDGKLMISQSGSCFKRLVASDFAVVDLNGEVLDGKPSKELPIHLALARFGEEHQAIIHTHSFYTTAFSCLKHTEERLEQLLQITPYLKMLSGGKIGLVCYAPPGSDNLFAHFNAVANSQTHVYILKNHGLVVSAKTANAAYNLIEELEASAHLYMELSRYDQDEIDFIS